MCAAYCEQGVECFPDVSASECRSLCLDEVKGIPCEADPVLLEECIGGMEDLSCDEIQAGELPRVCDRMCTGGLCEGVDCDDGKECTDDICNSVDGTCDNEPLPDGTPCSKGGCEHLVCTSVFSCTEDGILTAIATGGGPYTFACDGPTTIETSDRIVVDKDVILNGEGKITLDGRGLHTVLSVFGAPTDITVELQGFVVTGAWKDGAGISSNQADLTVSDCIVSGNDGPGIEGRGTLTVNDSTVSNNASSGIGGSGVFTVNNSVVANNGRVGVWGDDTTVLNDTTISGNGENQVVNSGTMTLNNCVVSGNAWVGINADSLESATVLNNSAVSGNGGEGDAGGIFSTGTLILNDSTVSENTGRDGGGIYSRGQLSMNRSTVSKNSGGGIYVRDGTAVIADSTLSENTAEKGAGLAAVGGETALRNSVLWGNTAVFTGGGIYTEFGTLSITNCTVSGNTALETGGGIHNRIQSSVVGSTISGNDADTASAIYFATGTMTLASSIVDGDCYAEDHPNNISSNGDNIEGPGDTCGWIDRSGERHLKRVEPRSAPRQRRAHADSGTRTSERSD